MRPALAELVIADEPEAWAAAGFSVDDDGGCRIGTVRVRLVGPVFNGTRGIQSWALRGVDDGSIDGLVTMAGPAEAAEAAEHPNGVRSIDHVVVGTDDCDRTVTAFRMFDLEPRRTRRYELNGRPMRQVFFRAGEVIVELVGPDASNADAPNTDPPNANASNADAPNADAPNTNAPNTDPPRPTPAAFWGLAHIVDDIDATASFLGDATSTPKDAVQPGRRISTLDNRRFAISVRTAFMSPHPPRAPS